MKVARATTDDLDAVFGPGTRNVWVCSPWITADGIALLEAAMKRCDVAGLVTVELWLRVMPGEPITDFPAVDRFVRDLETRAPQIAVTIRSAERLHAKALWSEEGAIIGSANLTGAAYRDNVEATVRFSGADASLVRDLRTSLQTAVAEVSRARWAEIVSLGPPPSAAAPPSATSDQGAKGDWADFMERLLQRRDSGGIR